VELVNALSLKFKLYFLLSIVIFGLTLIGGVGYFNMHKMKKNLDALYFGSLVPVTELNKVTNTYNKDIDLCFFQLKNAQITPAEAAQRIEQNRESIISTSESYISHFKRDYELPYIEYANTEILRSMHYLKRLSHAVVRLKPHSISRLSAHTLNKNIDRMNGIVDKIIGYESEIARYERKKSLDN